MAAAQHSDPGLHKLQLSTSPLSLKATPLTFTDASLICDMSSGTTRPVVPVNFRRAVSDSLHSLSHLAIRATQHLLTAKYVWPSTNTDVRRWVIRVLSANYPRSIATPLPLYQLSPHQMLDLTKYIWTQLVPFPPHRALPTYSPVLTALLAGQRLYRLQTSLHRQ